MDTLKKKKKSGGVFLHYLQFLEFCYHALENSPSSSAFYLEAAQSSTYINELIF